MREAGNSSLEWSFSTAKRSVSFIELGRLLTFGVPSYILAATVHAHC